MAENIKRRKIVPSAELLEDIKAASPLMRSLSQESDASRMARVVAYVQEESGKADANIKFPSYRKLNYLRFSESIWLAVCTYLIDRAAKGAPTSTVDLAAFVGYSAHDWEMSRITSGLPPAISKLVVKGERTWNAPHGTKSK